MRRREFWLFLGIAFVAASFSRTGEAASGDGIRATVFARDADRPDAPVSILAPSSLASGHRVFRDGETRAQAEPEGSGKIRLTWIAKSLKRGESRSYRFVPAKESMRSGVLLKRSGRNLDFIVNGSLFARYDVTTGPNKPYFYPLNAPSGASVVRHWPVEDVPGETHDHPHHRGLWFTHGSVNGVDFWSEEKGTGATVHKGYSKIESGPAYGRMVAKTDWIAPGGRKIAEDVRDVRAYVLPNGYLMDFSIAIHAVDGPLVWGDTKEGTFGLRLADSLRLTAGGRIVNSAGDQGVSAWGKRADWVDDWGTLDGKTIGVALFDFPDNPRHPTTWHARDYGLLAANPFGLHDFDPALKNDPHAGDLTTPAGGTIRFRYRLFIHEGTTEEAKIAALGADLAAPPVVTLDAERAR